VENAYYSETQWAEILLRGDSDYYYENMSMLKNLAVFFSFFLSIVIGFLGGLGLTSLMVFLFVKSYAKIIGFISDYQIYI
jgi:hypothetical protein